MPRAGHRAMDQLAFEEAAELFEVALQALESTRAGDPIERCDLLLALGLALEAGAGSRESYRRVFLEAGRLARHCKDPDSLAQAAAGFARYQTTGIFDEEGKLVRVVKFATDVTATKLQNAEYEGKVQAINRAQAVIEFGLDGTVLSANDQFLGIFGYELDEIAGRHHRMFCEPDYAESPEYAEFWQ